MFPLGFASPQHHHLHRALLNHPIVRSYRDLDRGSLYLMDRGRFTLLWIFLIHKLMTRS